MPKRNNYVSPSEFFQEVLKAKRENKVTNRLAEIFILFGEKTANHWNWNRYTHIREDIVSEIITKCVEVYDKFSPYRDQKKIWDGEHVDYHHETCYNPHAFFTMCVFNHLRAYIQNSHYTHVNIANKLRLDNGLDATDSYLDFMREQENDNIPDVDDEENLI